jgi:hypothetical protein
MNGFYYAQLSLEGQQVRYMSNDSLLSISANNLVQARTYDTPFLVIVSPDILSLLRGPVG